MLTSSNKEGKDKSIIFPYHEPEGIILIHLPEETFQQRRKEEDAASRPPRGTGHRAADLWSPGRASKGSQYIASTYIYTGALAWIDNNTGWCAICEMHGRLPAAFVLRHRLEEHEPWTPCSHRYHLEETDALALL
jgi:hypothetical protein